MFSEIKKLFSSRFTYVSLLIVFIFLSIFIVNATKSKSPSNEPYERLLSDINSSDMTEDELRMNLYNHRESLQIQMSELGDKMFNIKGEYEENLAGDYLIYQKAYELVNYKYKKFPSNRKQIISDSLYNISEEKQKINPNKVVIKSNEVVIEKYNRVINLELKNAGNMESMQHFFDNTIWEYAMIAFIVMLTVRMFTMDISCGAYKMIHSSKKGQRHLFKNQFFAVLLVITAITIVVALIQLICGFSLFGVTKLALPLQMYPDFEFCPYPISIGGFLLIKFLCKLLFYIMIASVTAMVSVSFRKQLSSFAVSLVVGILPLIAITYFFVYTTNDTSAISTKYKIYDNMRGFVPHGLLNIRNYFRTFDYINLLGLQISRIILALVITVLITVICFIFAFKNYETPKEVAI